MRAQRVAGDEGGDGRVDVNYVVPACYNDLADSSRGAEQVGGGEWVATPRDVETLVEMIGETGVAGCAVGHRVDAPAQSAEVIGEGQEERFERDGDGRRRRGRRAWRHAPES